MTSFRRLRSFKRQLLIACLLTVGTIWIHHHTSIQIIGNVYQGGKVSARLGIVYEWMKVNPLQDLGISQDEKPNPPTTKGITSTKSIRIGTKTKSETRSSGTVSQEILESHPFDNTCQYPVLFPEDENLRHVIKHTRLQVCKQVQPELVTFDYDGGSLIFNRSMAEKMFPSRNARCQYRPFSGGIRPRITEYLPTGPWKPITQEITPILDDLIEVQCFALAQKKVTSDLKEEGEKEVFRFAFGNVVKRNETGGLKPKSYTKNDEDTLSIDFLFLDSTSHNVMLRHMPKSWKYMKEVMGFYHLEGYTKVGDNSMVNLMPILAGLRYGDQAKDMPSEVTINQPIDVEPLPFLWKDFRERGCATLFNDDIADYTRGFLNYPWTHVRGFAQIPTDHFARPWHIYHRKYPFADASKFCFGNHPYFKLQTNFMEQLIKKYRDTCHFSFNFITDLPHDDPNNLELADDDMHAMLKRLYTGNYLNNTILFVMGDHGNRIGYVMYTYVGRIEERMTHFSVYIPEWYRRKYPDRMRQFELNKHRLTSNFDVHRMIREIMNNTLSHKEEDPIAAGRAAAQGVSLFRPIPANRSCTDANIPPPHCICLEPVPQWANTSKLTPNHPLYKESMDLIFNWTRLHLEPTSPTDNTKCTRVDKADIVSIQAMTTSQMIQHGVRDLTPEQTEKLSRRIDGDIEYVDVVYRMLPTDVTARIRLQYYKKPHKKLIINIPPHPVNKFKAKTGKCKGKPWYCQCQS